MDKIVVQGGKKLYGSLEICGSKNAFLPILAGCILCDGEVLLHNVPNFEDIKNMCSILQDLGVKIRCDKNDLFLDCKNIKNDRLPENLTKRIRSSIFCIGPLLARLGSAVAAFPGGCAIGLRPIDLHTNNLRALGVQINEHNGFMYCSTNGLIANDIHLRFASVGATENLMMACCKCDGISHIFNAAKEPEIVDLQNFLNSMGAKVFGAGSDMITIEGVKSLHSTEYTPISDRIVAGTYLLAAVMAGGKIELENVNWQHNKCLLKKLENNCCKIGVQSGKIDVSSTGMPVALGKVETQPYPGFPTDLQSQALALASIAKGESVICENLFETRFNTATQLKKMGAKIDVVGNTAKVTGSPLFGTEVCATDLRGGASLVLAGLVANGTTTICDVYHIDRGYQDIVSELQKLGANIKRIK